jgi:N-succinyldiaminopimelate aminotransferase
MVTEEQGLLGGDRLPYLASRLQGLGTSIFAEMSALAVATNSINLGQGFPDTDGPSEVSEAAIAAIRAGQNQYPPGRGVPALLEAVARHQQRFYGIALDPAREVLITAGATEAIAAAILALCEVGDEVVMFEPFYDSYAACVAMAGAQRRVVQLRAPDWSFPEEALEAAITPRTRLVLLNSPHNPTGKVFSGEELATIARLCVRHDLLAVTDEVYEHLIFDVEQLPLSRFPGMAERTVSISSGAKTFSFTGWKVGWVTGPEALVDAVRTAKQFLTYVSSAPFQPAIALGLDLPDEFFHGVGAMLKAKRDLLSDGLRSLGLTTFESAGTFFVTTDVASLGDEDAATFCANLPYRAGVVAIPSSVFYDDKSAGRTLVRWTFCKRDDVLEEALVRLKRLVG